MQPYFVPYAGYFRLFSETDLFVIYDCVQFPRRGWVHRNRLLDRTGALSWLTLPLRKAPQEVLIRDLEFADDARERFESEIGRFPVLATAADTDELVRAIQEFSARPLDYIVRLLEFCCRRLGLEFRTMLSSQLGVGDDLRGQDRILELLRRVHASRYVNSPGGTDLYKREAFESAGIELEFLDEYRGSNASILQRLLSEPADSVRSEILAHRR
jgi:hypothetical protein